MLEKVLDFQKTSMSLTDTSEDIDAHFRYIASKKTSMFFSKWTPLEYSEHCPPVLVEAVPKEDSYKVVASRGIEDLQEAEWR